MDAQKVKNYFENENVVSDYALAVKKVGLWESEKIIFQEYLKTDMSILELGCGAGRIAYGLGALGFKKITATDFSKNMVAAAMRLAKEFNDNIYFEACDATNIQYQDNSFDAAIFGFNGLMQIPKRKNRVIAIQNIFRILKDDGVFIFTTHDRDVARNKNYWDSEKKQWLSKSQDPNLDEFGDIYYSGDHGNIYIHSPVKSEILNDIQQMGFEFIFCKTRSDIADEPQSVKNFSDDCLFWVVKKNPKQNKNL